MSVPGGSGFEPSGVHGQPRRWQLRPLSEATPRQVRWLLPGLIPLRFLTLVAGVGGLGKSTWLVSVAAQGSVADAPWETIYVSFEDSADEVLRPRLEAAGGNPERVHEVVLAESGSLDAFTLPRDIDNLTTLVRSSSARLVVIDPVVAAVDTKLDAYKDQHVRQVLERLWQVAKDEDCAIALVGHLNRVPSTDAYLRIANPTAFWNAARSVVLVTEDGDADNGLRLIAQRKANLARLAPVERHRIVEFVLPDTVDPETGSPIVTSRMTFVEIADDVDPTTILGATTPTKTESAETVLEALLADRDWHESDPLKKVPLRRPLYLALTLYSTRGVQVGQGYLFKWPAALNEVFTSLHGMGQLTAGEPSEPTSDRPTGTSRRSRWRREQRFLKAVELHAMAAAASWYTAQGYAVEDVSARKSWDLEATRGDEVRRIEVKGSAGVRDAVDLTANEVRNATDWSPCDLFVVDGIELTDDGRAVLTGAGRSRLWANWTPAPDALEPVAYSHLLPLDPETLDVHTSIEHLADRPTS